jgi:hypothetical protein
MSLSSPVGSVSATGVYFDPETKKFSKESTGATKFNLGDIQAYSLSPTEGMGKYIKDYYKDQDKITKEGRVALYVTAYDATKGNLPVMLPLTDELEGKMKLNDEEKAKLREWKKSFGVRFNKNGVGDSDPDPLRLRK